MVLAVEAGHRMDRQGVEKWMIWTIIGGLTFLGCQAWEWSHFIHGSGGSFLLAENVTVTADDGGVFNLSKGDPVFMDHHFGHFCKCVIAGCLNRLGCAEHEPGGAKDQSLSAAVCSCGRASPSRMSKASSAQLQLQPSGL